MSDVIDSKEYDLKLSGKEIDTLLNCLQSETWEEENEDIRQQIIDKLLKI